MNFHNVVVASEFGVQRVVSLKENFAFDVIHSAEEKDLITQPLVFNNCTRFSNLTKLIYVCLV